MDKQTDQTEEKLEQAEEKLEQIEEKLEKWKRAQMDKYSFDGALLPEYMSQMLAYNGKIDGTKTCGICKYFVLYHKGHANCTRSKPGKEWNSEWPACGLFEPQESER